MTSDKITGRITLAIDGRVAHVMDLPWKAERRIGIEEARTFGYAAFGIPCQRISVLGEGWDFINFLADGGWVLRFPKRAACDRALVREREILEHLHALDLPAPVPRFEHFSGPRDAFPWHFTAYRYLEGRPLTHVDDERIVSAAAPAVGEFLAVLHQAPFEAELPSPWHHEALAVWTSREFEQSIEAYPADLRRRLESYLSSLVTVADPDVPHVWAHADMLEEHILVDPGTGALTGIIDWADACRTVRSGDFAGLFYLGGRRLAASAYSAYGAEPGEAEWQWLEQLAVGIGIGQVFYGHHSGQRHLVAQGLERLRRYLPSFV